ncbi:MarR family transcriptional regulator [Paenibacillus sp. GYB003]|uniref:MarR family transcriptional regulator n=1 Tax=Paenibacillus sp. GYB003 TaxID=2994392 RepID=UPI002F966ABF
MNAESEQFIERFYTAMETVRRKMMQDFSGNMRYGLTPPQFVTLTLIRERGPSKAAALADLMEVKPSAIAVMIDRLASRGFVERRRDEKDRRSVLIHLTGLGLQALGQMETIRKRSLARLFGKIDADEANRLLLLLEKLAE